MKPTRIITSYAKTKVRLFPQGVVMADIPTGRSAAFLHMILSNNPGLKKHTTKIAVDGFSKGHKPGYVIDVDGIKILIGIFESIESKGKARIDQTEALVLWLKNTLINELTKVMAEAKPVAKSGHITVTANSSQFSAPWGGSNSVSLQFEVNGVSRTFGLTDVLRALEIA